MYRMNGRVGIMAEYPKEVTTDIPEHAHLKNDPFTNWDDPLTPWDERTRGLGGTLRRPVSTVGEENLLCLEWDRYRNAGLRLLTLQDIFSFISLRCYGSRVRPWNSSYITYDCR